MGGVAGEVVLDHDEAGGVFFEIDAFEDGELVAFDVDGEEVDGGGAVGFDDGVEGEDIDFDDAEEFGIEVCVAAGEGGMEVVFGDVELGASDICFAGGGGDDDGGFGALGTEEIAEIGVGFDE